MIEKGLLGPGFLAHVVTERFGNHMPYYRLEKKYATEGLELSRSVLERSMARCAELLEPLYQELRRQVLDTGVIFTDDTPVTIAQPGSGQGSRKGRVWCYVDREDQVVYDFTESRKRDGPLLFLRGFTGFAHADAYPGYDALFLPDELIEVGCWAHARRKFVEAETTDPELSKQAVARIRELYAIERAAKQLEPDPARSRRPHRTCGRRTWRAGSRGRSWFRAAPARASAPSRSRAARRHKRRTADLRGARRASRRARSVRGTSSAACSASVAVQAGQARWSLRPASRLRRARPRPTARHRRGAPGKHGR